MGKDRESIQQANPYLKGLAAWFVVVIGLCILSWPARDVPLWWDSAGYVYHHTREIHQANLFPFLMEYDVGHPTLFYFLYAVMMKVLGVMGPFPGHLLTWGFTALGAVSFFALLRSLGLSRPVAGAWTAVFLSFPMVWASHLQVLLDWPLACLVIAAFACWSRKLYIGYVVFATGACLTKIYGFTIVMAPLGIILCEIVYAWWSQKSWLRGALTRVLIASAPLLPLIVFLILRRMVRGGGATAGFTHPDEILMPWQVGALFQRIGYHYSEVFVPSHLSLLIVLTVAALFGSMLMRSKFFMQNSPADESIRARTTLPLFGLFLVYAVMTQGLLLLVKEHNLARYSLIHLPLVFLALAYFLWRTPLNPRLAVGIPIFFFLLNVMFLHPSPSRVFPDPVQTWLSTETPDRGWFYENDLRFIDAAELVCDSTQSIKVHQDAMGWDKGVSTGWPIDGVLGNPEFGYTKYSLKAHYTTEWSAMDPEEYPYVIEMPPIFTMAGKFPKDWTRTEVARHSRGELEIVVWLVDEEEKQTVAQNSGG